MESYHGHQPLGAMSFSGGYDVDSRKAVAGQQGPPLLPSLTKLRKVLLYIGLVLVTLDLGIMPMVYYYTLTYHSSLTPEYVFIVIACLFCVISFAILGHRCLRLLLKCSERYGPLEWRRKYRLLEFTNVNCALCATIFETCLVIGTAYTNPLVRLCTMPPSIICLYFGSLFLLTAFFAKYHFRLPFHMSSTPKGSIWRPALLAILEDSGAIEGRREQAFRRATIARWEASPLFRRLLMRLTWVWGFSFIFIGAASTVLIFTLKEDSVAFGVGWGLPFGWSFFVGLWTVYFVRKSLREERQTWKGTLVNNDASKLRIGMA